MKKIIMLCLGIMTAGLVLAGCGQQAKQAAPDAGKAGKIVVGLDDNYPPMGFRDENNNITGFDVDLAKEAAKRLKEKLNLSRLTGQVKKRNLKADVLMYCGTVLI